MSGNGIPISEAEFDRKLEAERARWLRRRFLWFCGAMTALSLLFAPFILMAGPWDRVPEGER